MIRANDPTSRRRLSELQQDARGFATTSAALERIEDLVVTFLEDLVDDAGVEGVVVPLDGDLESTVTAAVAVDALGADRVSGLVMPAYMSHEAAARHAEAVASALRIEHSRVQLQPVLAAFQAAIGETDGPADDLVATRRALSGFRTTCANYVADTRSALVAGTVDRTDLLLGAAATHDATGVDCLPLGDLYRTEVRTLARELGVPDDLVDRPSEPWGLSDRANADELDAGAETIDRILRLRVDDALDVATVADRLDVDPETVERVSDWCANARRERYLPPTPGTGTR